MHRQGLAKVTKLPNARFSLQSNCTVKLHSLRKFRNWVIIQCWHEKHFSTLAALHTTVHIIFPLIQLFIIIISVLQKYFLFLLQRPEKCDGVASDAIQRRGKQAGGAGEINCKGAMQGTNQLQSEQRAVGGGHRRDPLVLPFRQTKRAQSLRKGKQLQHLGKAKDLQLVLCVCVVVKCKCWLFLFWRRGRRGVAVLRQFNDNVKPC